MWYLKYFYCKKCFYFPGCETFVCDEVCDALPLENETYNYIHTHIRTNSKYKFVSERNSSTSILHHRLFAATCTREKHRKSM